MGEPGCDLLDSRNANADDSVPHVLCLQIFGMCRMPVPLGVFKCGAETLRGNKCIENVLHTTGLVMVANHILGSDTKNASCQKNQSCST